MPRMVSFREALRYWLKLGFISFGGPTGQIAIMHKDLVEKKKWIGGVETLFESCCNMSAPLVSSGYSPRFRSGRFYMEDCGMRQEEFQ